MSTHRIERLRFSKPEVQAWGALDPVHRNWPVVYVLDETSSSQGSVYVGESRNVAERMLQHLSRPTKQHLEGIRVVIDSEFNKSVCLDLEAFLIQMFSGDGQYSLLNIVTGAYESDYYDRDRYRAKFNEIFEELRSEGVFTRTIPEIRNSDLFKLSPFKALTTDQAAAVEDIVSGLFDDVESGRPSTIVIEGEPGTGKTILGIYMMKLLRDIATTDPEEEYSEDNFFTEFFTAGHRELIEGFRVGLVVPQQSLRKSIHQVFRKTPGLDPAMAVSPFDVGSGAPYDLLIVDEAHRLNQRANQSSGVRNRQFAEINAKLFGSDDKAITQLDWIKRQSSHQIFLVDSAQSVRPADVPRELLNALRKSADERGRWYRLKSQMRVQAGDDYVGYVRRVLEGSQDRPRSFEGYDLRFFDDFDAMWNEIRMRDSEHGLARLVAGYAWPWVSKGNRAAYDIKLGSHEIAWNRSDVDWVNSPGSLEEMGSIHTIQGYDLNYAGVVIGGDLWYDTESHRIRVDRASYYDKKGKENNPTLGITYTDEDLLRYITNVYSVLLTRGMLGTYVYVVDPALRENLRPYFGGILTGNSLD